MNSNELSATRRIAWIPFVLMSLVLTPGARAQADEVSPPEARAAVRQTRSRKNDEGSSATLIVRHCPDGSRCSSNGMWTDCAPQSNCMPEALYFGSRIGCVFSMSLREPYCVKSDGSYTRSSWDDCGKQANDTTCSGGTCAYCLGCADGSSCGDGGGNNCQDGSPCDCLPGRCLDGAGCFRPQGGRVRWRFPAGNEVIASPTLETCTEDKSLYTDVANRNPGLKPEPVDNRCIFIGAKDSFLYAFDEDARERSGTNPPGSCLWHLPASGMIHSRVAADPASDHLYVGDMGGALHKVRRYPVKSPKDTDCNLDEPLRCDLTMQQRQQSGNKKDRSPIEGDPFIPKQASTPLQDRLLVGSGEGMKLFDTREMSELGVLFQADTFRSAVVQSGDTPQRNVNLFYSTYGKGENRPSGLVTFHIAGNQLVADSRIDTGKPTPTPRGQTPVPSPTATPTPPPGCAPAPQASNVDILRDVQWHRTEAVPSADRTRLFLTNRATTNGPLRKKIMAFNTPNQLLDSPTLAACYPVEKAVVAPAAYARVNCKAKKRTDCCGQGDRPIDRPVDRIFFGTKDNSFVAVDFCDEVPEFRFVWDEVVNGKTRALPAVSLELGTVYSYSETNQGEILYAFDIANGTLKWKYDVSAEQNNCRNGTIGGRNCYPAPMILVADVDSAGRHPVTNSGCYPSSTIKFEVKVRTIDVVHPRDFESKTVDVDDGATEPDWNEGIRWVNEKSNRTGEGQCVQATKSCTAEVPLVPGENEIVFTARDTAGKRGNTRITINHQPNGCG